MGILFYLYPLVAILFVAALLQAIKKIVNKEDFSGSGTLAALCFAYLMWVPLLLGG